MGQKPLLDDLHIAPMTGTAGFQITCTDAAAINTQYAVSLDTAGYESNIIMVVLADTANVYDMVFTMNESDVSAADAGTAVDHSELRVMRDDGVQTKCPATTGVLTLTAAVDDNNVWLFEYLGDARWIHLVASVGTADIIPAYISIQGNARRAPTHVAGYAGP